MTKPSGDSLDLTGQGAAYLRVSDDKQDVQRQVHSIDAFEKRHKVAIAASRRYKDDMPRDLAPKRVAFQRMMNAVETGAIKWIVVDQSERFGYADEWEFVEFLGKLRKAGCKLVDTSDHDWTARGLMSFFRAGLAGHSSREEQEKKSYRSLGGMMSRARAGEWMGGPPKLGFDVACFDRATNTELWRAVYEGRDVVGTVHRRGKERPKYSIRRLKVYPGGRTERLDGNEIAFRTNKELQVMRLVPTLDQTKLAAAKAVFERYATEAVTFFDLAKWLNGLGIRNSFGKLFQSRDISKMLTDETYLGYPTFAKRRSGRFNRPSGGNVVPLDPESELRGRDTANAPEDMIRSRERHFEPMVSRPTWDVVQTKLSNRPVKTFTSSPKEVDAGSPKTFSKTMTTGAKNPAMYLAGLLFCAKCSQPMVARSDRAEYYCGTWDKHRVRGALADSPCLRNGVRQSELEPYINRYLDQEGHRVEQMALLSSAADPLTGKLADDEKEATGAFLKNFNAMQNYLATHHADEWKETVRHYLFKCALRDREGKTETTDPIDFFNDVVATYRDTFDPAKLKAEEDKLQAEYMALMNQWRTLPTPLAQAKATEHFLALESRIEELRLQQQNLADFVENYRREMAELRRAIFEAQQAMKAEGGVLALRQKAERLRGLLCAIECEFVVTGKKGAGPGNSRSELSAISFKPVDGHATVERVDSSILNGRERSFGKP